MSNITQNGGIIYIQQSGSDIQYQSNSTSGAWTNITSFPVTIVNSNPVQGNILTISIITNITIILATGYFICGSSYITFDGTGKIITIANVSNYLGLIQNGTNLANGYSNVTVQNINSAISGSSTLATSGGWICQSYFGKGVNNILIDNCSNSGTVNRNFSGGIGGEYVANNGTIIISNCSNSGLISIGRGGICGRLLAVNGNSTILNCLNTGNITANFAGGITGSSIGSNNGNVSITDCINSGVVSGTSAGGITGVQTGQNVGTVSITNCTNSGIISGISAGGICGAFTGQGNGKVSISNCANNGSVSGQFAGGITGLEAGNTNGSVSITNCNNSGIISGNFSGGISGNKFGSNSNNLCSITNCYNTGEINGNNSGGITGALVGYNDNLLYTPNILIKNCYSFGNIASTAGGICGGADGTSSYTNTPIVNITNCYTVYDSIADSDSQYIATSLPIKSSIILTNVYSSLTNAWSDTNASSSLSGALNIYRNSRLYKYYSNFGEVWYSNQNNTPFFFTSELNTVPRRQIRD